VALNNNLCYVTNESSFIASFISDFILFSATFGHFYFFPLCLDKQNTVGWWKNSAFSSCPAEKGTKTTFSETFHHFTLKKNLSDQRNRLANSFCQSDRVQVRCYFSFRDVLLKTLGVTEVVCIKDKPFWKVCEYVRFFGAAKIKRQERVP
jgi:hypothetical protein